VLNPTSIYAYLADSDKELCNVTGLLPVPAGPAGAIEELTAADLLLFRHNPYPELAKGLAEYWMAPENLRVTIEAGDRRWGPPYQGMYDSDFWKRPVFEHWCAMLERGRQFPAPGNINATVGEVLATNVIAHMMHRVLVESGEAEKAVEEAHRKVVKISARHAQA
jgi:ABC-type glycerol-3-phosphate transport system substrate-binding protein